MCDWKWVLAAMVVARRISRSAWPECSMLEAAVGAPTTHAHASPDRSQVTLDLACYMFSPVAAVVHAGRDAGGHCVHFCFHHFCLWSLGQQSWCRGCQLWHNGWPSPTVNLVSSSSIFRHLFMEHALQKIASSPELNPGVFAMIGASCSLSSHAPGHGSSPVFQ